MEELRSSGKLLAHLDQLLSVKTAECGMERVDVVALQPGLDLLCAPPGDSTRRGSLAVRLDRENRGLGSGWWGCGDPGLLGSNP